MLARKEFIAKVRTYKQEQQKQDDLLFNRASTVIQARVRGILHRRKCKKLFPVLRVARKMRSLCVECERQVALRRCRECKDQFCVECYGMLHQKGKRQAHTWVLLTPDARALGMAYELRGCTEAAEEDKGKRKGKGKVEDWQEFYDDTAQAKYWFNKVTGEASWKSPFT